MLEVIFSGLFRGLWWLVSLPFKKRGGRKREISIADRNDIVSKRMKIEELLSSDSEIELKHSVMEADKLVDKILKLKNYSGDTFADRLRSAEKHINRNMYESIWYGHKIRNQIAHDSEEISRESLVGAARKLLAYTKEI